MNQPTRASLRLDVAEVIHAQSRLPSSTHARSHLLPSIPSIPGPPSRVLARQSPGSTQLPPTYTLSSRPHPYPRWPCSHPGPPPQKSRWPSVPCPLARQSHPPCPTKTPAALTLLEALLRLRPFPLPPRSPTPSPLPGPQDSTARSTTPPSAPYTTLRPRSLSNPPLVEAAHTSCLPRPSLSRHPAGLPSIHSCRGATHTLPLTRLLLRPRLRCSTRPFVRTTTVPSALQKSTSTNPVWARTSTTSLSRTLAPSVWVLVKSHRQPWRTSACPPYSIIH